uniref:Uncharacterized protein n=1 Tax=Chrysotila carterae TaxID=13221 RepID=A0A7S4B4M6_CHRCT|mmetsp:Transcript_41503/g.86915  ORF Transcript_41503/g.86915 Transcript_41503/m.86915 type:complete len:295 (-) Transcript_41503:354-1238(-)
MHAAAPAEAEHGNSSSPPLFFHEEPISSALESYNPQWSRYGVTAEKLTAYQNAIRTYIQSLSLHTLPSTARRYHWRRCALVGSSGSLLGRGQGAQIDQAQAIFRINEALVKKFERDVGSRTTVRISNVYRPFRIAEMPDPPSTFRLVYCQPTRYVTGCWSSITGNASALISKHAQGVALPRLSTRLPQEVTTQMRRDTAWRRPSKTPSTGAVALYVAMRMCAHVSVFGFGNATGAGRLPQCETDLGPPKCAKYYGHACIKLSDYDIKDTRWHDLEMERAWIRQLAETRRVDAFC